MDEGRNGRECAMKNQKSRTKYKIKVSMKEGSSENMRMNENRNGRECVMMKERKDEGRMKEDEDKEN